MLIIRIPKDTIINSTNNTLNSSALLISLYNLDVEVFLLLFLTDDILEE
jgi:hypothetical protein